MEHEPRGEQAALAPLHAACGAGLSEIARDVGVARSVIVHIATPWPKARARLDWYDGGRDVAAA